MNQLKKLFLAHLKMTFRDKGVWFWSIGYPVFLLVIFLTIFGGFASGGDDFEAEVAVVAANQTEVTQQVEGVLRSIPVLKWKEDALVDRSQAEEWIKDKKVDAVIVLPDGESSKQFELIVNREDEQSSTTQVVGGILRDVVNSMDRQAAPTFALETTFISSGSDDLTYSDFLLTGMIALSICQAGLFGMVGMVEMRRNGLLKRLKMTPVNMKMFGLGDMLVRFLLSAIQIVLLSGIGYFFYDATFHFDIPAFLLMFIMGTLSFASMGYMIAAFSKSMESFMGIVNLFSFIMMFLSGIFFDAGALPQWLVPVADLLPLSFFVDGIRDGMVYGISIFNQSFWINFGVLLAWMVVTFAIGSKFYKWKPEAR